MMPHEQGLAKAAGSAGPQHIKLAEAVRTDGVICAVSQVWWGATLGIVLAFSRAFVQDSTAAFQPELAMMEVGSVPPATPADRTIT